MGEREKEGALWFPGTEEASREHTRGYSKIHTHDFLIMCVDHVCVCFNIYGIWWTRKMTCGSLGGGTIYGILF